MRLSLALLASTLLLSGCMTAPGYSEQEQSIVDNLDSGLYQPASRQARDAVETQSVLAQATFWSREAQLNPADLEAAIRLTSAVRKMGNTSQAVDIAQMARQMHPRDPYLLAEYSASLIADERGVEAMKPLQEGLRTTPAYGRLWSLMGAALDQQEQYADARRHYERALQITPNDPNVLANMGLSFALEGNAQVAEQWLRRAAAQPGAGPGVEQNLDLVLKLQGKPPEKMMAETQPPAPQFAQQPTWARSNVQGPNMQAPNGQGQGAWGQETWGQTQQGQPVVTQSQSPFAPRQKSVPQNMQQGQMSNGRSFSVGNGAPRSASDAARMAARQGQGRTATVPMGQAVPGSFMLPQNTQQPQNSAGYAPQQLPAGQGFIPQNNGYQQREPQWQLPAQFNTQQQPQTRGPARRR